MVPIQSWLHKFVLWLLYIHICQTPEWGTLGVKLVCKYIAYYRQPSKSLQIQLVYGH